MLWQDLGLELHVREPQPCYSIWTGPYKASISLYLNEYCGFWGHIVHAQLNATFKSALNI